MNAFTVHAVIAILAFGVFSGVNRHEFVDYGDRRLIVGNALVVGGFDEAQVAQAFVIERGLPWQPLSWMSLQVQANSYGVVTAKPYLFGNLALHIIASLVLLFALARLTGRFWPSAFVAAVFVFHPVQAEIVAWATARPDALSAVWLSTALAAWAFWVERPTPIRYACVVAAVSLGVLSGGRFAALPFGLLLLDVWPLGRLELFGLRSGRFADRPAPSVATLIGEKAPLLAIALFGVVVQRVAESGVSNSWGADPDLFGRVGLVLVNLFEAAGRLVWPSGLAFTVPNHLQMGLGPVPLWQVGAAGIALCAVTFGLVHLGERARPLLVGWLWYLVFVIPVAGFVPSGLRMLNDRSLGFPLVGLAIAFAFGAAWVLERVPRREIVVGVTAALVLVPLALATRTQVEVWRDSDSLFDHALAVNDRDAMAHYYKGMRLVERDFETAGVAQLERAVEIYPDHIHAGLTLGQLQIEAGEPARALVTLNRPLVLMPESAIVRVYVSSALMALERPAEALETIDEAIALEPENAFATLQRARMHLRLGDGEAAIVDYRRALELDPSNGFARAELGHLERVLSAATDS